MTREEFQKDEDLQAQLRQILGMGTLKLALDILDDEVRPRKVADPVSAGANFHRASGVQHVLDGLDDLTRPVRERKPALANRRLETSPPETP